MSGGADLAYKVHELARMLMVHGQRHGQALFNALYTLDPHMADLLRGSDVDPFHNDGSALDFINAVVRHSGGIMPGQENVEIRNNRKEQE